MLKILEKINKTKDLLTTNVLGLDIGHSSIKFVEVKKSLKGSLEVINFGYVSLEPKKENPEDSLIINNIRQIKEKYNIQAKDTIIYSSLIQTFTQLIYLPKIKKKELKKEEAIWWEAKKNIPYDLKDVILDFEILDNNNKASNAGKLEIIVSAAKKEEVFKIASFIRQAELMPCGIIPWSLIGASFLEEKSPKKNETICLIDIGSRSTKVGFYKDAQFQLARNINIGGCTITEALTTPFSSEEGEVCLDYSKACDIKFKYGLMLEGEAGGEPCDFKHLSTLIRPVVEKLVAEIKKSIELFHRQSPESKITKVAIFGGGSLLKGLDQFLKEELQKEIVFLRPPLSVSENESPKYTAAYILSLHKGKGINLLPFKFKIAKNVSYFKDGLKALAISSFILILVFLIITASALIYYNKAIRERQAQLAALRPSVVRLQKLMELKSEYEPHYMLYSKLIENKPQFHYILKELSLIVPRRVKFDVFVAEDSNNVFYLKLQGLVFANAFNAQQLLADFIEALEESAFFSNVKLVSMSESQNYKDRASNFEVLCRVVTTH